MKIQIGRVEVAFAIALALSLCLGWLESSSLLFVLLQPVVLVLGVWVIIRITRRFAGQAIWRLRNRLIVAYLFIALVPVVLISALVAIGAYIIVGQLSIYLVTSELERRNEMLTRSLSVVLRQERSWQQDDSMLGSFLRTRFPGIELVVTGKNQWKYPADSALTPPPGTRGDTKGLVIKDGLLYGWAHLVVGANTATAMVPITRELLGDMAPGIAESSVLDLTENERDLLRHSLVSSGEPARNRRPPATAWWDREVVWGSFIPVAVWDAPGRTDLQLITARTRPSALLRTIFPTGTDVAYQWVATLFLFMALLFLVAEMIALFIGVSLTRTITGAVHNLYEGTLRIKGGEFSHRIPTRGKDQLGELSVSFNQMTEQLQRLVQVEKEKERLQGEIAIAREVQSQLHPKTVPDLKTIRVKALCDPARMVSGDYYDYQQLQGSRVAIAVGDVAGKGISAALLMATVQSCFRTQLRGSLEMVRAANDHSVRFSVSTSGLVSQINQQLHADTAPEKYATFFFGVYDEPTSIFTYTNAGHLPPILVRNGAASRLDVNGMVVGAFPFAEYDESRVELQPGDLLVLFTDGISEPENEYEEMFGEERLTDVVLKNAHLDEDRIVAAVVDSVREWTGKGELQDDMTLVLVRRTTADLPAEPKTPESSFAEARG
ncbi:MAG: PP2C family protein-serine/threonine phosphatase [Bryobacteraceae bacterium]